MKTKKVLLISVLFSLLVIVGCKTTQSYGTNAVAENKQKEKIDAVQKAQIVNTQAKIDQVAVLSSGTDYALNKITNKEPPVEVAQDLNRRIMSLSGKADLDAEKEIWIMVDELTSDLLAEKEKGKKALIKKDEDISALQSESRLLADYKDKEIDKYVKLAQNTARKVDTLITELDSYKGWFGLKAVGKGLWQFIKSITWILLGGGIVYLLLRGFATTNPIVGSIFSIFSTIGSWVIHTIESLIPKSVSGAGYIHSDIHEQYKEVLIKIIDGLQFLKEKDPNKQYTIDDICNTFKFSTAETDLIDGCKKELKWK